MATTATLEPPSVSAEPGSTVGTTLTLRNDSSIVEAYTLAGVGPSASWTTFTPATVSVYPGKSESVAVTFTVPRAPSTPAGVMDFGISVIPSQDPANATVPEGQLSIAAFADTTAELIPRVSHGGRSGRVRAAVDNRGNVALPVQVSATDQAEKLTITPLPPAATVDPGAAAFFELRIKPIKTIWRGAAVSHQYAAKLVAENQPPIVLDGTFLQEAVVPKWVSRAALAVVAAAAVLVIAWFTLLRPAVTSAAREAIKEPAAEIAQDAASAQQAAEIAKAAASGTPPTDLPTTVPGDTPRAPTAASFRLTATDAAGGPEATSAAYTVPSRSTFKLTDIFLSNPQGDSGQLDIRDNDDQTLFTFGLENFRDLDYHFLTPMEFGAKDQIKLVLNCDEVGDPPGSSDPEQCNSAVRVSGTVTKRG